MRYEIRALSFSEILDTSIQILRNHFKVLVGIAAVLFVPMSVAMTALSGDPADTEFGSEDAAWIVFFLFYVSVAWPVVAASLAHAIGELYRGNEISIGEASRRGWRIILPLSGTALLAMLGWLFGLLLLVIPGIVLMLSWAQSTNVMVFEEIFGPRALRRSTELMRGHRIRALGLFLVSTIAGTVLASVVSLAAAYVPVVGPVIDGIGQSINTVFLTAVGVVLYFDLRCRKEQFDLEHLASLVAEPVASAQPALS